MNKTIVIILISFAVFIYLSAQSESRFTVQRYDNLDNLEGEEELSLSRGMELAQAVFGPDKYDFPFYIMSAMPATDDDSAILSVVLNNPYEEQIQLINVDVTKNDEVLVSREFKEPMVINPKSSYKYKTINIGMEGKETQLNIITVLFTLKKQDGTVFTEKYEYKYYVLVPCNSDSDCSYPNSVCDKENIAGFSSGSNNHFYCVKSCLSNQDCYTGQVCKFGRCGY